MASEFTAINPKLIANSADGADAELIKLDATDSKTWGPGELGYLSSGKVTPLSTTTGGTTVFCQFKVDQPTSTSSSKVWVNVIPDGAQFECYVTNNGTDAAIGVANIGTKYAMYNDSGVCKLDLNVSGQFEVIKLAADYEPERNLAADTPGKCIVAFRK